MKVAKLLESRRANWRALEELCRKLERGSKRKVGAVAIQRFAALYRAACADLALADAYQLPPATVNYLHQLVARAHNQLYRSRTFDFRAWMRELFVEVPQRLFNDVCLRLAFVLFWGFFLAAMYLSSVASPVPQFPRKLVGNETLDRIQQMYADPIGTQGSATGGEGLMAGYYINHNTSIGLRCFAAGLLFGVGGLFTTVFNAIFLGSIFGYMTRVPQQENFFHFVTAHGPFELTAIVLSAGAGMRLGFSLVDTGGLTRRDSLVKAGREAMPTMGAAIVLFALAALIEGFLSPSSAPYIVKAAVAAISTGMLMFYFVILGYPRDDVDAIG